jgi:hypothetical protein
MLMEIACRIGTQKCLYRHIHRIKVETKITKDLNICNSALFYSWVICNVTVSYFIPGFHLYSLPQTSFSPTVGSNRLG